MHIYGRRDALSKKTLEIAVNSGNNAIVQVKGNQKKLLENCKKATKEMQPKDEHTEQGGKIRNRIENRKVQIFENPQMHFDEKIKSEWGIYANTIIKIQRDRKEFNTEIKKWESSSEISYYISTIDIKKEKNLTVQEYAAAIQNHWAIENKNHCVKDASMDEDRSRIRINPDRIAKLRSISLNVLRINKVENIKNERYKNSLNFTRLFKYRQLLG